MHQNLDRVRVREIAVERRVVREPGRGRIRALLETTPSKRGRARSVRLALLAPDGTPAVTITGDSKGNPRVVLRQLDPGDIPILTTSRLDLWSGDDVAASLWTDDRVGHVDVLRATSRRRR